MTDNQDESRQSREGEAGGMTFADFAFLQYQQARFSLGEFPHPTTGKYEVNLPLAQYSIDLLAMLKEKTRGNLTAEEDRLLDNILHELRIVFVEKLKAAEADEKASPREESGQEAPEPQPGTGEAGSDGEGTDRK